MQIYMESAKSLLVCFSFLTVLQQSAEAQEAVIHPQMQWMKTDRANPLEVSSPFGGGVFNPVPINQSIFFFLPFDFR